MSDYNAADTRAIRKAEKAAKAELAERKIVVFNLMSSPAGRSYIHSLLFQCHIFSTSFSSSALGMAFSEGERNIGLKLLTDIMQHAPDQYIQMMREATDRNSADGRRTDNHSESRGSSTDSGGGDSGPITVVSDYDPGDEDRDEAS